jgi:hypothetical protein
LIDHAALIAAASNNGDVWLGPFEPLSGQPPVVRFLLPLSVAGHSLALAQVDSNGAVYNTPLSSNENVWVNGTYYPKAIATYDPSRPFWVADLTDRKKSPSGNTDLRAATWEPDYSQYPLVEVRGYLEGREIGHKFTVYYWAYGGPIMTTSVTATLSATSGSVDGFLRPSWLSTGTFQVPAGSAVLSFPMGEGMYFYISRDADNVNTPDESGYDAYFQANSSAPLVWSLFGVFPDPPNRSTPLQTVEFRLRSERANHTFTVLMSDGYSSHFVPGQYSETTITEWNGQLLWNPLMIISFTASIDPSKSWWLRADTTAQEFPIGQTDIFDGWTPQFGPPYPTITIHLPAWANVGIWLSTYGSYESIVASDDYQHETTFYTGVDGMTDFTIESEKITFPNPNPEYIGPYGLNGLDSSQWPVYAGDNDFQLNLGQHQPIALNITTSRWEHELVVRHSEGTSYPIEKHATQGDISFDPNQNAWWNTYSFFDGTSSIHLQPPVPWYVEDRTTNERIGPYPTNEELINWLYLAPPDPVDVYLPVPSSIGVSWTAVPGGAQYRVERRLPFGDSTTSPWSTLSTISAPSVHYIDSAVVAGKVYAYRVIALAGTLESSPSEEVWAALPQPLPPDPNPDSDGNGIADSDEGTGDSDGDLTDNAHDPDNDNDGIPDAEDEWPDDPRRSETIPPKYYGIVDLKSCTFEGNPVPIDENATMAIDNSNNVSWLLTRWSDVYQDNVQQVVTWRDGVAQSVASYGYNAAPVDVPQPIDEITVHGINGAGKIAGEHYSSPTGSAINFTVRAVPGDRPVPASYRGPYSEDNSDFADTGFCISFVNSAITNTGISFGTMTYVSGSLSDGHAVTKLVRYEGLNGDLEEAPINGSITALSDSRAAVITRPPPTTIVNELEVQTAEVGASRIWKNDGSSIQIGSFKAYAVNRQNWVVGSKMHWERDPETGASITLNYEGPEPDAANPYATYGRGELGFVWNPALGLQTFHDMLPAKYRKQIRNAVPYMITNVDSTTGYPRIFFKASMLTDGAPNGWKEYTFLLEWDDPDGTGPNPGVPKLRYVSLGEKYDSSTDSYREVDALFVKCNDNENLIGWYGTGPAFFGPIEILDNQKKPISSNDLAISKWEEAFNIPSGGGENPLPELKADFISDLHDSFYFRYPFSQSPQISTPSARFSVERVVQGAGGPHIITIDDPTTIKVVTEGLHSNTAITEKSHILVSSQQDDTDVLMNTKGTAADDSEGDRTHLAALGDIGALTVDQSYGVMKFKFPIPDRKRLKILPLKIYLVRKSVGGPLCADRTWLERFLAATTRRLAQVNIKPVVQSIEEIDPPGELNLSRGLWTADGYLTSNNFYTLDNSAETERLIETRAKRSEDDVEIFVVNYFSLFFRADGHYYPHRDYAFAHIDSNYTLDAPAAPRLSKPGSPGGQGPRWKRGVVVVAADSLTANIVPGVSDPSLFDYCGAHEIAHVLGDMDHEEGEFRTVNLMCAGDKLSNRRYEHPVAALRLLRLQESRMRSHRALK